MKQYWNSLQPRERRTLLGGGVALVLLLVYALVWTPYQQEMQRLRESVTEQQAVVQWMEQAAAEVRRQPAAGIRRASNGSLLSVIDSTARARGLGEALKRVQPERDSGVRVWFEQVAFDEMLLWLDQLAESQGVRVEGLVVERRSAGRVDARLVLER